MSAKPAPLLCIDGPSLMYRAWFGLPDTITDDEKRPVNALLGTANLVLRTIATYAPRAVVFCDGAEAADYRKQAFPRYHADRPATPEGLVWQFEQAPDFFAAFGWRTTVTDDLEADDLLGAYAAAETAAAATPSYSPVIATCSSA